MNGNHVGAALPSVSGCSGAIQKGTPIYTVTQMCPAPLFMEQKPALTEEHEQVQLIYTSPNLPETTFIFEKNILTGKK